MKIKILQLFFILSVSNMLVAQNAITVSGSNGSSSTGNVSFSVGQPAYVTDFASNGSVSEGVQQPYEISTVLSIKEAQEIHLLLSVFPNPTSNFVTLKVENYDFESLHIQLIDANGKLFYNGNTTQNETKIEIGSFTSSIYFLKVSDDKKELKTFKILKK